jgi:hypothetical protein
MATLFLFLLAFLFAALFWWVPFNGWRPLKGLRDSRTHRWKVDLVLMVVLLVLSAVLLGVDPSVGVMAVIVILAAAAAFGMQTLRDGQARRLRSADGIAESTNVET